MKKLTILLLKTYIGPFAVTFIIALVFLIMQTFWLYLDDILGKGLSGWVIFKLIAYASARLVNMALPMAILISSILTAGALSENHELTAMKSGGISLPRIFKPLFVFIVLVGIGSFFFANNVWPITNLKFKTLMHDIIHQKPAFNLKEDVFYTEIEGYSIRVDSKDDLTNELEDVLIYDHSGDGKGNRTVIRANRGRMQESADGRFLEMHLFDGHFYDEPDQQTKKNKDFAYISNSFREEILRIDLSGFAFTETEEDTYSKAQDMMSIDQLRVEIDSMYAKVNRKRKSIDTFTDNFDRLMADSLQLRPDSIVQTAHFMDKLSGTAKARTVKRAKELSRQNKDYFDRAQNELDARFFRIVRFEIEIHRKFNLAVVCIVLFLIGISSGTMATNSGQALRVVFAVVMFVVYYLLSVVGEELVKAKTLDGWQGMWLSTAVLLPLALFSSKKSHKRNYNELWKSLRK